MTRPDYRNRGLARQLIKKILQDYENQVDGLYLFGNLSAVGFYTRLGFLRGHQYQWLAECFIKRNPEKEEFVPVGKDMREAYVRVLKNSSYNAEFDHINRCSLQMFYTMDMEDIYYNKELDCFAVMRIHDHVLYLDSIVSTKQVTLQEVQERINGEYSRIVLGFIPKERNAIPC